MIHITDVVDLIIDKKVKELESLIEEKRIVIKEVEKEDDKTLINFYKKIVNDNFVDSYFEPNDSKFGFYEGDYLKLDFFFRMAFLSPKGFVNRRQPLYDDISKLVEQRDKIKNSKESLIAEVTLQHLSNLDVDFKDKIEELTERIFNNQLTIK